MFSDILLELLGVHFSIGFVLGVALVSTLPSVCIYLPTHFLKLLCAVCSCPSAPH